MLTNKIDIKDNLAVGAVLAVVILQENEYYIAQIPALNLSAHAKTQEEAEHSLDDAIDLFFKTWNENGRMQFKLAKLGWQPVNHSLEMKGVKVPIELLTSRATVSQKTFATV